MSFIPIPSKRIRIAADISNLDAPCDVLTNLTPAFYRGNDLQVEFAIFVDGTLQNDTGNIASVTMEIRPTDDDFTPPDPTTAPLMAQTIAAADLVDGIALSDWNSGVVQQGIIKFSAAQSNISAGPQWMTLWMLTNDSPGRVVTLAAGPLIVREDGSSMGVATPPTPTSSYYTSTQSDARYLQQGQNLSDIATPSAARLNLGLGSAAVLNTGDAVGNVPVVGSSGLLDSSIMPEVDTSTLLPRGGIILNGGWATIPALVIGKSDFDFLFLVKRESWGADQYIFSGTMGAPSLRFTSTNTLRMGVVGVGDILESSGTVVTDADTWVRLTRSGGMTTMYLNGVSVGSLADGLNYTGSISWIGCADGLGTSPFIGTILCAAAWNRGLDAGTLADYQEIGGTDLSDRWGSMTNIYNASSLVVGKRVYLKTNGTDSITINGQQYKDGTGTSVNATSGVEIVVASATITNALTSASTLRYEGQLFDLDCNEGCGYQLHDRTGNKAHALLSPVSSGGVNVWDHCAKKREWQLYVPLTGSGYIGGSAATVLPAGHIITGINAIGGAGITLGIGSASGDTSIVSSLVCNSTVANATLAGVRTSNNYLYATYNAGSGNVTLLVRGVVE
jgi:hypothetical protein